MATFLSRTSPSWWTSPNYIVAANIPYNITSAIIRHLLESDPKPRRVVLTIQKEVAERICAQPGDLSLLALSVQVYGQPRIAAKIPAGAFHPAPKVDSAILRIDIYDQPLIPNEMLERFFKLDQGGVRTKTKDAAQFAFGGTAHPPAKRRSPADRRRHRPHAPRRDAVD
jgi:16S rRNA (adenine1518-N6/adenine1519-N6)-dimethyltransferase